MAEATLPPTFCSVVADKPFISLVKKYRSGCETDNPLSSQSTSSTRINDYVVVLVNNSSAECTLCVACVTADSSPKAHPAHLQSNACKNGVYIKDLILVKDKLTVVALDCVLSTADHSTALAKYRQKLEIIPVLNYQPLVPPGEEYTESATGTDYFRAVNLNTFRLYASLFQKHQQTVNPVCFCFSDPITVVPNSCCITIKDIEPSHVDVSGGSVLMVTNSKLVSKEFKVKISSKDYNGRSLGWSKDCQIIDRDVNTCRFLVPDLTSFVNPESVCMEVNLSIEDNETSSKSSMYSFSLTQSATTRYKAGSKRLHYDYQPQLQDTGSLASVQSAASSQAKLLPTSPVVHMQPSGTSQRSLESAATFANPGVAPLSRFGPANTTALSNAAWSNAQPSGAVSSFGDMSSSLNSQHAGFHSYGMTVDSTVAEGSAPQSYDVEDVLGSGFPFTDEAFNELFGPQESPLSFDNLVAQNLATDAPNADCLHENISKP